MPDPNCPDCRGTGRVTLFTSSEPCRRCAELAMHFAAGVMMGRFLVRQERQLYELIRATLYDPPRAGR
jgi:hypothetical protein